VAQRGRHAERGLLVLRVSGQDLLKLRDALLNRGEFLIVIVCSAKCCKLMIA
jgi:hypothetical protein